MQAPKLLFLAVTIIAASAGLTAAQVTIDVKPGVPPQTNNAAAEQNDDIVNEVFSPITDRLNLTAGQKFRIANIATATMLQADPLFSSLTSWMTSFPQPPLPDGWRNHKSDSFQTNKQACSTRSFR